MEILLGLAVCGLAGAVIGNLKNRMALGFALGFFLGPIGWLITALFPAHGPKCPDCGGIILEGARKCKNCGTVLSQR